MTLQEFAALKDGDEIENGFNGSRGRVTEVNNRGVIVSWHGNPMTFTYTVNSTQWMHWERPGETNV